MAVAFLKPASITDTGANIDTGTIFDISDSVAAPDGNVIVSVDKQWASPFFVEFPMGNLPGGATSINSVILRVRNRIVGTWVDDSVQYAWTIFGSNLAHPLLQWDFQADGGGGLSNRQQTVTESPSVADVNAATVRVTQSYSASMSKESITSDADAFELEVDYSTGGTTLVVQDSDHFHVADLLILISLGSFLRADKDASALSASFTPDLGSNPASGNLLIVTACAGDSSLLVDTAPVGFTLLHEEFDGELVGYWWFKISDGTEQTVTVVWDGLANSVVTYAEFVWDGSVPTLTKNINLANINTVTSSQPSGAVTPPGTPNVVIAAHFTDGNQNSFVSQAPGIGWGSVTAFDNTSINQGEGKLSSKIGATGSQESIHTDLDTGDEMFGAICVFEPGGTTLLVMQESTHLHDADLLALVQANVLAMQDADHLHDADLLALLQANVLALNDSDHLHTGDNIVLDVSAVLAMQDADHLHDADLLALIQANVLAMQDADHLHDADLLALLQANVLALNDSDHLHTGDNLDLVQANVLALDDSDHLHDAENLILNVGAVLVVQDSDHLHDADNLDLVQAQVLVIAEAFHAHVADNLDLVQANVLAVADSDHLHDAENLILSTAVLLVVAEAFHLHVADALDLIQANVLAMADADHLHDADNLDLTQANVLAMADADHLHTGDGLVLDVSSVLAMQDADHLHDADPLDLVQASVLVVQDADHDHTGDNLDLIQAAILAIDEAFHDHTADGLVLDVGFILSVAEAAHSHTADNLDLTQANVLAIANAFHDHIADQADLISGLSIIVSDAVHQVVSDNLNLFDPLGTLPPGILFTIDGKDRVFVINTKDRVFVVLPSNRV